MEEEKKEQPLPLSLFKERILPESLEEEEFLHDISAATNASGIMADNSSNQKTMASSLRRTTAFTSPRRTTSGKRKGLSKGRRSLQSSESTSPGKSSQKILASPARRRSTL